MSEWMADFFMDESEMLDELNLFGWQHITVLLLTLAAGIALFHYRDRLRRWRGRERLRYWMSGLYLVNMVVFYSVFLVKGIYDWHIHLPFHLCFITNFLFVYCLLTNNRKFFRIVYFYTWVGPLPAMLMPNTPMRADRFLCWHFIISHHLLLLMGLYCLFVLDWRVERKDIGKALLFGNGIFLFMYVFNTVCGTNYIMTTQLPEHIVAMFPFLTYLNYPVLWLELCGLAGFFAAYLPAWICGRRRLRLQGVQNTHLPSPSKQEQTG